FLFMNTCE
ncbi:hypothetical protein CFC21_102052, partial [Triticum aestivum]